MHLTNYAKNHSNLSSPVKVFVLYDYYTLDKEHPKLDYINLGVTSLINKYTGFSY